MARTAAPLKCKLRKVQRFHFGSLTEVKTRRWKRYSINCYHHRYWHYQDTMAVLRSASMRVISQFSAYYLQEKPEGPEIPFEYW